MAKEDLEMAGRAMMAVTSKLPGSDEDDCDLYPVLGLDSNFDDLPADDSEYSEDELITKETVLKLAAAAIHAIRMPTEAMMNAGAAHLVGEGAVTAAERQKASLVFKAMIDVVLRPERPKRALDR